MVKQCILEDKVCDECGRCNLCDLDQSKVCDNCCACLDRGADYSEVVIDDIVTGETVTDGVSGEESADI